MNKQTKKSGFAHVAIIAVIFLMAIIGILGFVFWQNYTRTKNVSHNSTNVITPGVELTEIAYDKTMGTDLAVKYPKSWSLKYESHKGDWDSFPDFSYDRNSITSPDGNMTVKLDVFETSGPGLWCDNTENAEVIDEGNIVGYSTAKFVSFFVEGENNCYFTGAQKSVEVNGNNVAVSGTGHYFKSDNNPFVTLNVNFNDLGNDFDVQDIKSYLTTENYKVAKLIVQSLYVRSE